MWVSFLLQQICLTPYALATKAVGKEKKDTRQSTLFGLPPVPAPEKRIRGRPSKAEIHQQNSPIETVSTQIPELSQGALLILQRHYYLGIRHSESHTTAVDVSSVIDRSVVQKPLGDHAAEKVAKLLKC